MERPLEGEEGRKYLYHFYILKGAASGQMEKRFTSSALYVHLSIISWKLSFK